VPTERTRPPGPRPASPSPQARVHPVVAQAPWTWHGSSPQPSEDAADVLIVGLGYVGLTLAVGLAAAGAAVVGFDVDATRGADLRRGDLPFYEPGLAETLAELPEERLRFTGTLPERLPRAVVICVGTPVDEATHQPDLAALQQVVAALRGRVTDDHVVVLRSTVPVGTARRVIVGPLRESAPHLRFAVCPERTIQGQALRELRELPQVIGGLDLASADAASQLFRPLSPRQVRVSSIEAAEMVKLVNNCHTDTIYGFGNEVALLAEALGLDAVEVIDAANVEYPRPNLHRPGFVGGGCLTKDPYLLMASTADAGHVPGLVAAARRLNEAVPEHQVDRLLRALKDGREDGHADGAGETRRVLVCGLAYKGSPPTDDTRGSPAPPVIARLRDHGVDVVAHDHMVSAATAERMGARLVDDVAEGFAGSDGVIVLTDHPGYAALDARAAVATMRRPGVVVDGWGVLAAQLEGLPADEVTYLRFGRG
jgi:UDP-N-acetyl-D-mannosaminuronic acid dehydrogenase